MSTRFKRAGAIVLLLAALAVGGTLALRAALQHVEPFYAAAVEVDPAAAAAAALQLEKRVAELATPVAAPQWDVEFTETEVNGWLATVLRDKLPELLPPTVQDPRVQLAENRLLLGFRYIDGAFQSVVAIETEPGLPQPGVVSIRLKSARIGFLPLSRSVIVEQVNLIAEDLKWPVIWDEIEGELVMEVPLQELFSTESEHRALTRMSVAPGIIQLAGVASLDDSADLSATAEGRPSE